MKTKELIADIFRTVGQPTITYVARDSGKLERELNSALDERGQICLITGPSKTGKTTLYREVITKRQEVPLVVQCDRSTTVADIWKTALEAVDFSRVESRTNSETKKLNGEVEVGGKLGWKWLAEMTARLKVSVGTESSEAEIQKRVLAEPGPDLLIPILKLTSYTLIIEDFHYLEDHQKTTLFQQWKRFVDNEVSVIILGTTHRAVDIANSNKDLLGRISQFDVGHWTLDDLRKIVVKGFEHLELNAPQDLTKIIATEAAGLPIIVQQACLEIFTHRQIIHSDQVRGKPFSINTASVHTSLHSVATKKYTQFEAYYTTLIRGPREKSRKYKTYELVIACFTLDPIQFSLNRGEIDRRIGRLKIPPESVPPAASINSTLGALKKFQEKREFTLLEWRPNEEILYIIEPTFLFYVRWRKQKASEGYQPDLFEILLESNLNRVKHDLTAGSQADLSTWWITVRKVLGTGKQRSKD